MKQRIAVVGGGPAGATCARRLAAAGADVTIFEARPSGEKPCGGGIPGHALATFPDLADPSLIRRTVREVHLYAPSERRAVVPLGEGIHVFRRRDLDTHLRRRAEIAGARLVRERVVRIRRLDRRRWSLTTEVGARGPYDLLVGADGVNGVVRRTLVGGYDESELNLALYAYVDGVPDDAILLKFVQGLDGYLWLFPRIDHASIGICTARPGLSRAGLEEALLRAVARFLPGVDLDRRALRGFRIPASPRPSRIAGDGWALVGDAAGFVDPITREGIAPAMRSGEALAERFLATGSFETPPLPADLSQAHRWRSGFFRTEFLERMVDLVDRSSAVRTVCADLFSGRQPYRSLRRRLAIRAIPCGVEVALGVLAGFRRPPPAATPLR